MAARCLVCGRYVNDSWDHEQKCLLYAPRVVQGGGTGSITLPNISVTIDENGIAVTTPVLDVNLGPTETTTPDPGETQDPTVDIEQPEVPGIETPDIGPVETKEDRGQGQTATYIEITDRDVLVKVIDMLTANGGRVMGGSWSGKSVRMRMPGGVLVVKVGDLMVKDDRGGWYPTVREAFFPRPTS